MKFSINCQGFTCIVLELSSFCNLELYSFCNFHINLEGEKEQEPGTLNIKDTRKLKP